MKDKKYLAITSALILLPCVAGLILWNRLPEQMPTHFGADGNVDGWSGKPFAVFGVPLILLAFHWLCIWLARLDRRNWEHNHKMMKIIFWLFPALSGVVGAVTYSIALGMEWNISRLMLILMGILFICMGNYLPKCRLNPTLGIKLKWTLYNEENWNKTHRFGGKVWMAAGLGCLVLSFLPLGFGYIVLGLMLVMIAAPVGYSYLLYRKQLREGTWTQSESSKTMRQDPAKQKMGKWSMVAVAAILVLVAVLMFSGKIGVIYYEDHFVVEASYHQDAKIYYDEITAVEFRSAESFEGGTREWGFGSPRLLLGLFRNAEFGQYTRYTYTNAEAFAIITCGEDVLVLTGKNAAQTEEIAWTLSEKIG